MSRPPAMSTRSKPNVRSLAPTHITKGPFYTNLQFADPSPAAPHIYSRVTPAMPPMPLPSPPASVSCHKDHAIATVLRVFCIRTTSLAHYLSKSDRVLTATASCYESPSQHPVTRRAKFFSKLGQSGQNSAFDTLSIPCRYPVSEKLAAGLRHTWTLQGQFRPESAPFLRTCAATPSKRLTPPICIQRRGRHAPAKWPAGHRRIRRLDSRSATVPGRAGISWPRDDAQAMLAIRARSFCGSWPETAVLPSYPPIWDAHRATVFPVLPSGLFFLGKGR